jgi:hypothetical protein
MKFLFLLLSLLFFKLSSEQVNFSEIPFTDALQKAHSEGKIIFLQFEAADCYQCNDVANKGFENKEVADKINTTFFCLKINAQHPDRNKIATAYNINADKGFGTLFIDNNGTVVHKFLKTTSFSKEYSDQVDIALMKAGENLKINELEKEYKNGNRTFGFLQSLLEKRRSLNFPTDSLLDEYIEALPDDSLKSVYTLGFIAQMTPLLDSKADIALRKDAIAFDKAWYTIPLQMRIRINNAIIYNSMSKAIKERNEKYAIRTAAFAQGTNGSNYLAGVKAYDKNLLRFYDETGDTTAYFRKSIAYLERYLLTVNPDSIKRIDSIRANQILMSGKKDTLREGNVIKITNGIPYAPIAQNFARELNDGAYEFFKRTDNPYLLSIATDWAKKALQFYKSPQVLDTYAKLLYKQNQKEQAIEMMNEAIDLQQKHGLSTKQFDTSLEKMKTGKTLQY